MQAEAVKATQRRTVWNVLRRNLSLTAGCLILLCVVFTALFPGLIASQSPTDQNLTAMLAAPSAEHIWGTDELGRDIFARVIWGTRYDLVIGLAAASVPFIVGTLIGLFTAYFGGILDTLFMRLVDVMMSFPVIVLIIAIVAVLGPGIGNMYLAMWLVGWTSYARLVRSAVMVEKNAEYVQAARTLGYSHMRILFRHILPNVISGAIVYAVSDILMCMLMGAGLSFLGVGVQPPTPEWGMMLNEAKEVMTLYPLQMIPAGMAILLVVAAFNFLGDSLRDAFDPKHAGRERS